MNSDVSLFTQEACVASIFCIVAMAEYTNERCLLYGLDYISKQDSIWSLVVRRTHQSGKQTEAIAVYDAMAKRQNCESSEAVCGKKNKRGLLFNNQSGLISMRISRRKRSS